MLGPCMNYVVCRVWCAWPCWLGFLPCPWMCTCHRVCAWWWPGTEPGTALDLLCLPCFGTGGLQPFGGSHCLALSSVAPVLPPLRSCCSLTSSAWQSCHTSISSCSVIRPWLFSFSFYSSVIILVVLCVSFLGWLHLLKEGTATTIRHVHLCPYVMDLHSSEMMFLALLSTFPNNCCHPIFLLSTKSMFSENCPKWLQHPSKVVIASLESLIAFIHGFFFSYVSYSALIGTEFNLPFYCQVTQYHEIILYVLLVFNYLEKNFFHLEM